MSFTAAGVGAPKGPTVCSFLIARRRRGVEGVPSASSETVWEAFRFRDAAGAEGGAGAVAFVLAKAARRVDLRVAILSLIVDARV